VSFSTHNQEDTMQLREDDRPIENEFDPEVFFSDIEDLERHMDAEMAMANAMNFALDKIFNFKPNKSE
jgi:hypothetical protein